MILALYIMYRIYLAATKGYGLGPDESEELGYYNKPKQMMDDIKKNPIKRGIPLIGIKLEV